MLVDVLKIGMDPGCVLHVSGNSNNDGESLYFPLWMQNYSDLLQLNPVRSGLPALMALAG